MIFSRSGLIAVSLTALLASGCSSSRFASEDTTPEPLTPAPAGTVTGDQLPPPSGPATTGSQFPSAPDTTTGGPSGVKGSMPHPGSSGGDMVAGTTGKGGASAQPGTGTQGGLGMNTTPATMGSSPDGGTPADEDRARTMIGALGRDATVADGVATLDYLGGIKGGNARVGAVGFCWGGGMVNADGFGAG